MTNDIRTRMIRLFTLPQKMPLAVFDLFQRLLRRRTVNDGAANKYILIVLPHFIVQHTQSLYLIAGVAHYTPRG